MFDGVAKDKFRRGELFGIANLLKFKPGTFMNYAAITETKETKKYADLKDNMHSVDALKSSLLDHSEKAEEILFLEEEDMFPNIATRKGTVKSFVCFLSIWCKLTLILYLSADDNSDEAGSADEGIIGGESQLMLDISNEMGDIDDESDDEGDHNVEDDNESVQVYVPVAETKIVYPVESSTADHEKYASGTEPGPLAYSRKSKQVASSVDMSSSRNYSLVGHSAHNLLQKDSLRTSFRMSDFALPNNKGKKKWRNPVKIGLHVPSSVCGPWRNVVRCTRNWNLDERLSMPFHKT